MVTKDGLLAFKALEKQDYESTFDQMDSWIQKVLEDAAPSEEICGMSSTEWAKASRIQVSIKAAKLVAQSEYQVTGSIEATVPSLCGRCGEPLQSERNGDFSQYFQVVESDEAENDSGDPDLIFTSAAEINLGELISEQLKILEPMVEHHPDGSCEAPLDVINKATDTAGRQSPFAGLKGLKLD